VNVAVAFEVGDCGPKSIVVSGGTGAVAVAIVNGERLATWPQTCAAPASTDVVASTQALPSQ
jgi:hypothetical protein